MTCAPSGAPSDLVRPRLLVPLSVKAPVLLLALSFLAVLVYAPVTSAGSAVPPSAGTVGEVEVSPAPDASLSWSPRELMLRFPDPPTGVGVELRTADGYPLPPATEVTVEGNTLRYPNPQIYTGTYTVSWDGPHAGSYRFSVSVASGFESVGPSLSAAGSAADPAIPDAGPSRILWPLLVALSSVVLLVVVLRRRPVLAVTGALLLSGLLYLVATRGTDSSDDRSACLPLAGEERLACLGSAVLSSFDTGGVAAVTRSLHDLEKDARFRSAYGENVCHTVAHMAARDVVARVGSLSEVTNSADLICASGFLHGAIEGGAPYLTTAVFTDEVLGICGDGVDNASIECAHGVGHGVALRLNSRLPEAVDVCLRLANEPQAVQCILGAAMLSGIWIGNMAARDPSPEGFTPPGLRTGIIGEVCMDEAVAVSAERFRACLEGVFFYMKPGQDVIARLPAPWNSVDSIAEWCAGVAEVQPGLAEACFSGVGSAAALRLEAAPETMPAPCARASGDAAHLACVAAVLTQVRNNQDVSPPREVFEGICAAVPSRLAAQCRVVSERLINRNVPSGGTSK